MRNKEEQMMENQDVGKKVRHYLGSEGESDKELGHEGQLSAADGTYPSDSSLSQHNHRFLC